MKPVAPVWFPRWNWVWPVSIALYALLAAITIPTLRPWIDEAWAGVPAWTLAEKGYAGTPSMDGSGWNLKDLDRYCYWIPPLFVVTQAVWYEVVPFSLESLRLLTTLLGLTGVVLGAYAIRKLTDELTASLFLLLAVCNYTVVSVSVMGRADSLGFLCQMAAYAAYLHWRESNLTKAIFASCTFVMLSGLAHPNAGLLSVLGILCIALTFDRKRIGMPQLATAATPFLLGAIPWGAYILQNVPAFRAQYGFQTSLRFFYLTNPLAAVEAEVNRYTLAMGLGAHSAGNSGPIYLKATLYIACFAAVVWALVEARQRARPVVRIFALMLAGYLVFYTFLEATKASYYLIYVLFLWLGFLAIALATWWRERRVHPILVALVLGGILVIQAGGLAARARSNAYKNSYLPAVQFLRDNVKPGQYVIGSLELGFSFGFHPDFMDDFRMGTTSGRRADYIVIEEIYEDRLAMMQAKYQDTYKTVRAMLDTEYTEVYNRSNYRILKRKTNL